jgi:glycosyltransferase involved in cell wall biosynthesis
MVVHAYYPLGETRVEREALALVDHGYEVDVLCLRDEGEAGFETVNGINIYRFPVRRGSSRGLFARLREYLTFFFFVFFKFLALQPARHYQVVQAHNLPDFLIFSALIPKLMGARLILDIHDRMPEFFAALTNRSMDSFFVRCVLWQEQLSCRFADHVVTVTELWRKKLIDRGIRPDKVSVVMNVADDRIFRTNPALRRTRRKNGHFHLIYHGTFKERYGLDVLIRAVGLVRERLPGIQVIIQGEGEFHGEMVRLVNELDLRDHVHIHASVLPTEKLPALITQADAGVVPNRNDIFTGDLLPTKLMEYVALDVPVIAARTRVISEYFDDAMVCFFIPGDAASLAENILDLYRHPKKLQEQVLNAERFISTYNWKAISSEYVRLVNRLAGNPT